MQQLFHLLIFLNQPYMFRATNSPILRSTFDCIYSFGYNGTAFLPSQPWHRSAAGSVHCTQSCICSQKCSSGWANLSPETCRTDLKRLINEKVVASSWLLTSLNLVLLFSASLWYFHSLLSDILNHNFGRQRLICRRFTALLCYVLNFM